jgi:hypothetical protein
MNEPNNNIIKTNEDLKKVFVGIIKDLRQITKGFQKLVDTQKNEISEKVKKSAAIKQEKYKEKIVEKQKIDREKKILKYLKDKKEKGNEDSLLSNILGFAKLFLLTFGAAGLISIIGKTEIGKLLGSLIKSIAESFVSVGKDLLGILGTAFKESSGHIVKAVKAIFSGINDFFGFISGALTGANGYRQLDLANILKSFFDNVIVKSFHLLVDVFQLAAKIFTKIFQDNTESIKTGFIDLMTSVFDTITSIVKTIITTLYSDAAKGQLTSVFESIKKIFVNLWELLKAAWVGEFKNAKGDTTTFGNIILKYFGIWAGLQLGIAALNLTMLKFGAAMAGFFDEIDSANSMRCCCKNMASNILDVAEEIDRKPKTPTTKPGSTTPTKTPGVLDRLGKTVSAGWGKVTNAVGKVSEAGKIIGTRVTNAFGQVVEYTSTKAAQMASKIEAGYKAAKNKVADMVRSLYRMFVAVAKNKTLQEKVLKKISQSIIARFWKSVWIKVSAAIAAAVAIPVVGVLLDVFIGVSLAYDLYQIWHWFFVSSDGETEDGGYYKEIEAEVNSWWKENDKPTVQAPPVVAPPAPAPKSVSTTTVSAAPVVTAPVEKKAEAKSASAPASTPTSASASTPTSAPTSTPAVAPAPVVPTQPLTTASVSAPSAPSTTSSKNLDELKAQAVGGATANLASSMKQGDVTFTKHSPGLDVLAQNIRSVVPNFGLFTAFNDKFHQVNHPRSSHAKGLAIDFTVRGGKSDYAAAANQLAGHLQKQGFKFGTDFLVVDEANVGGLGGGRNKFTTGDHVHVQFQNEEAAARYRSLFPTQQLSQFSKSDDEQQLAKYKDIRGTGNLAAGDFIGGSQVGGQVLTQAIEQTNEEMNDLRDVMLDMISQNLMSGSEGMTFLTNNNVNVVNQKGSTNKKFTDPDIAEKIFKNAFAL